jgi:hypothetical protein
MNSDILISNLTNPTLLFFVLGILAVVIKSDLEIPAQSVKFISLYLLFAIGFKGGQELSSSPASRDMFLAIGLGVTVAALIPVYVFYLMKRRLSVADAGAIAATYGSVSAVTFVSAVAFLESIRVPVNGYMVAVMALMEAPAIVVAVILMGIHERGEARAHSMASVIRHSFTNGSVLLILGSLLIGAIADVKQAEGIRPFTTDIFKGFLSIFLLDMGMTTAKRITAFRTYGWYAASLAVVFPLLNGGGVALLSRFVLTDTSDRFMLSLLAASASYIAVPAAMKLAAPKADPGLFVPMALGVTFPFNITVGMPLYYALVQAF